LLAEVGVKLIVGLGNPGRQYSETRHNAGFWFLDELALRHGGVWVGDARFAGELASVSLAATKLLLLKPQVFMNRSGQAVGSLLRYYKFGPENVLVVHDELDLAVGAVKFKKNGGHAGHNGLRNIIEHLGSRDFYRLRIGIDRPADGRNVADYVLSAPSREERVAIASAFERVHENIELLVAEQFDLLMNRLH
jgi:PTH1 family peptidyl-tRNA hydrolase